MNRPSEVIAGLNLPMLIKLASLRGREPLEACVSHAQKPPQVHLGGFLCSGRREVRPRLTTQIVNERDCTPASAKSSSCEPSSPSQGDPDDQTVDALSIMA